MTYQKIIKVLGLPDGSVRQFSAEKNKIFFVLYLTHPHIFRHTFASRICENETNVKIIQQLMGHADVSTTMNIYAEVNAESTRESIENLAKNLDVFQKRVHIKWNFQVGQQNRMDDNNLTTKRRKKLYKSEQK